MKDQAATSGGREVTFFDDLYVHRISHSVKSSTVRSESGQEFLKNISAMLHDRHLENCPRSMLETYITPKDYESTVTL